MRVSFYRALTLICLLFSINNVSAQDQSQEKTINLQQALELYLNSLIGKSCANNPDDNGPVCIPCQQGHSSYDSEGQEASEKISEGENSHYGQCEFIDNFTMNLIDSSTDYSAGSSSASGCGPCGGGVSSSTVPELELKRFRRMRNMTEHSSFGTGIFQTWDMNLTLFEDNGETRIELFDPTITFGRHYFLEGNDFIDTFGMDTDKLQLFNSSGIQTTDMSDAATAKLWTRTQRLFTFEIFDQDSTTRLGRLVSMTNPQGYGITISYVTLAGATVSDYQEKWKINTVSDDNNRTLTYTYLSSKRQSRFVVSAVTLPNGSSINYNYGSGNNDPLTSIDFPDSTSSNFSSTVTSEGLTKLSSFDTSKSGFNRQKHIYLSSNFAQVGANPNGVQYYSSASMQTRIVTRGSAEEVSYLSLPAQDGDSHGGGSRHIYQGTNSMKLVNATRGRHYSDWTLGDTSDGFDAVTGTEENGFIRTYSWTTAHTRKSRVPSYENENDNNFRYLYNSMGSMIRKTYEDDSREEWERNSFQQVTRYRDREGRVTHYVYDTMGNMTSKKVGLVAVPDNSVLNTRIAGVSYLFAHGKYTTVPTISSSDDEGAVSNFNIESANTDSMYALEFEGDLNITTAGDYTFATESSNGSLLYIDGQLVVDNDGYHTLQKVTSTTVTLTAGYHSIKVGFFSRDPDAELSVFWNGPDSGNVETNIPDSVLSHIVTNPPEIDQTTVETAEYKYTYYASGHANEYLLKSEEDANGNVTTYEYYTDNLLHKIITPNDDSSGTIDKSTFTYDTAKRLLTSKDALNRTTSYSYDDRDRVIKITYSDFSTEKFKYGTGTEANLLIRKKDRNGNVTRFDYDDLGRRTQTVQGYYVLSGLDPAWPSEASEPAVDSDPDHSIEICTYLTGTNLKKTCTVNGDLTEYGYDYRQRRVKTVRYPDAGSTLTSLSVYSDTSLLFSSIDPYGRSTFYSYRAADSQLVRQIQGTVPSYSLADFVAVDAEIRDLSNNADFLVTDYSYDLDGLQKTVTDSRGIINQTSYDSRKRAVSHVNDLGGINQTVETIYDANSNVVEIRNPRYTASFNDRTTMVYSDRNLLLSRTVADGSSVAATEYFTYDLDGRELTYKDFRGNMSVKVWKECCGRLGVIASAPYLDKDNVARKSVQIMEYDYYGNVTHTAVLDWDGGAVLPPCCYPDPLDSATEQESTVRLDARHRPIAQTVWQEALGYVDPNAVDIAGDSGVTEQGLTTKMIYFDEAALSDGSAAHPELAPLLTQLNNDGISFNGNANGAAVVTINPAGEVSVSIQDGIGRTVASGMYDKDDWALGTYTLVTWQTVTHDVIDSVDTENLLETKSTSALGYENRVWTDGAGRRIAAFDAENNKSEFEYDANSNPVKSRDANGVGLDCEFDELNRDEKCTDTYGDVTEKVFDLSNNVIKTIDAKLNYSLAEYDERNRLIHSWDRLVTATYDINSLPPAADATSYEYDANSNVTKITDSIGKATNYLFDTRNMQEQVTYADSGITKCFYDALGRKEKCLDQLGDSVTYVYDLAGRMTGREYRTGDTTLESTDSFTYDDASRIETAYKGRYDNKITFTYDEIGRKKSETAEIDSTGGTPVTFTTANELYDADNRIKEILYPTSAGNTSSGRTKLSKTYTGRNQLKSLTFNASTIISEFKYDAGMREYERTFGNGLVSTKAYRSDTNGKDNLLSNVSVSGTSGSLPDLGFSYTYDANKNVTGETAGGDLADYSWTTDDNGSDGYDKTDRVTHWERTGNSDSQDWTLDRIGNWNSTAGTLSGNSFNEARTHNDVHELTVITPSGQSGINVTYDDKGNMTVDANGNTLVWDIDNHLISVTSAQSSLVSFTYDALGRRISKEDGSAETVFISNGQQVVEEYSVSGGNYTLERSYVHGTYIDDIVAKIEGGGSLYYHSDRQYNVRGLTNSGGDIVELYAYSVYGKCTIIDPYNNTVLAGSAYSNSYGFTGRYLDVETGLWYFRARYFSEEMGRFISRDPLGYVDGMSLYQGYFAERFFVDPSGLANPNAPLSELSGTPIHSGSSPTPDIIDTTILPRGNKKAIVPTAVGDSWIESPWMPCDKFENFGKNVNMILLSIGLNKVLGRIPYLKKLIATHLPEIGMGLYTTYNCGCWAKARFKPYVYRYWSGVIQTGWNPIFGWRLSSSGTRFAVKNISGPQVGARRLEWTVKYTSKMPEENAKTLWAKVWDLNIKGPITRLTHPIVGKDMYNKWSRWYHTDGREELYYNGNSFGKDAFKPPAGDKELLNVLK